LEPLNEPQPPTMAGVARDLWGLRFAGARVLRAGERIWGPAAAGASSAGRPGTHRVEVPFRTSHIMHLKASALFRKVQTLQSQ
jgi:hypothetical protein